MAGATPRVAMPAPMYNKYEKKNYRNTELVPKYGLATVQAAEVSAVIDIILQLGLIRPYELLELIERKCAMADSRRQEQADEMIKRTMGR